MAYNTTEWYNTPGYKKDPPYRIYASGEGNNVAKAGTGNKKKIPRHALTKNDLNY